MKTALMLAAAAMVLSGCIPPTEGAPLSPPATPGPEHSNIEPGYMQDECGPGCELLI